MSFQLYLLNMKIKRFVRVGKIASRERGSGYTLEAEDGKVWVGLDM